MESELQRERGCVDTEAVFETCVDQSDPSIVCCYSDECNRWSTGHNRQARISGERLGVEGEEGRGGGGGGEGGRGKGHHAPMWRATISHCMLTFNYLDQCAIH